MLPSSLWLLCIVVIGARAQGDESSSSISSSTPSDSSSSTTSGSIVEFTFTNAGSTITGSLVPTTLPTGSDITYLTGTTQSTRDASTRTSNNTMTTSSSNSQITVSTESVSLTQIVGGTGSNSTMTSRTSSGSATSSAAAPTNTVPCNGHPEFCERQYSNITMITAHNAAFVQENNAASNQLLGVKAQLEDGVRMIQGQVHWDEANETLYNCHSSCDLLNTGPYQGTLEIIREFIENNPYDVVTILIGNADYVPVETFVPAITNAGLLPYVYEPTYIPQHRNQWPTLSEMILSNQRVVIFMDYDANQDSVPYILDEFSHIWETPFSPTDPSFPCTQQRPPDLDETRAREEYMYLANHNLNVAIDLSSLGIDTSSVLLPNTAALNVTNAAGQENGMLGRMASDCTEEWDRPPNFLLVDYYNVGPSGDNSPSVFEVAATANGVEYTQECCGVGGAQSAAPVVRMSFIALVVAVGFAVVSAW